MKNISKKWLIIGGILVILPFLLNFVGFYASGTWRYKITVVVETPEGLREGSAVRQVSHIQFIMPFDFRKMYIPAKIQGEAVVVDLGERGPLFATMRHDIPVIEFYEAYDNPHNKETVKGIRYYNKNRDDNKIILDPKKYPPMVTFGDLTDPTTVQLVKGWSYDIIAQKHFQEDNTEKFFGEGVAIKEVSIQRTDDMVTRGKVEKYLDQLKIFGPYAFVLED